MKLNYFNYRSFNGRILLTNDMGQYVFVDENEFKQLISKTLKLDSPVGKKLQETGMVYAGSDLDFVENSEKYLRDIKGHVATATSLHIFVVTTSCNMDCVYCQANNGSTVPNGFMTEDIAEKAVDIALQSPELHLSFEFQGGEPLLNYPVIAHIILYAEEHRGNHEIEFNLVSNLTMLTDEMLDFFEEHHCTLSTSLDGAKLIHDRNRPYRNGRGTFDDVVKGIKRVLMNILYVAFIFPILYKLYVPIIF